MNPESKEFIIFALQYLEDPEVRHQFFLECKRKFANFISRDPNELKEKLQAKLVRGSEEHGSPAKYTLEEVDQELEYEFVDILGWSLVRLFNERKGKKSNNPR